MAVNFLKRGADAHNTIAQADKEAEAKKQLAAKGRRFWIKDGGETQITFLDGTLLPDGRLDAPTFWEHQIRVPNSKMRHHYVCVKEYEPCPICDSGETPALVVAFTIVDHSEYTDKNGKLHRHNKSLFVCKRDTFKRLQKIAQKRGGLAGITFDVSRTGDKSAAVGSDFDFVDKINLADPKAVRAQAKEWGLDDLQPINYEEVFVYRDAKTLRAEFGFGGAGSVVGAQDVAEVVDVSDEI